MSEHPSGQHSRARTTTPRPKARSRPARNGVVSQDSLFPGGPGNTDKDPQRFTALIDDLEARVFGELADDTWAYPGHGGDTTVGAERPSVPEWRARGW